MDAAKDTLPDVPLYRADQWPDDPEAQDEVTYIRGRLPDDLEGSILELGYREIYRRLQHDKLRKDIQTHHLVALVRDLGRLQLAKQKPEQAGGKMEVKQLNFIALAEGLPPARQLEVLQQALVGAEPERQLEIKAAIAELEGRNGRDRQP